jgi:hypothetical protein
MAWRDGADSHFVFASTARVLGRRMTFEDLGIIFVPLLVLLVYRLLPFPDDPENPDGPPAKEVSSPLEAPNQPRELEVSASHAPAAGSALPGIASMLILGILGYVFALLVRRVPTGL